MLAWSYDLLPKTNCYMLRWSATSIRGFTLDAAHAVGTKPDIDTAAIVGGIVGHARTSLFVSTTTVGKTRHSFLETMVAYVLDNKP
jgi:hypothetical protein